MAERYFVEPYQFVPPVQSKLWCNLVKLIFHRHVRRTMGIERWKFEGLDLVRESIRSGCGVLLTPNHSRWADGAAMAIATHQAGTYCYYGVSYHLFKQGFRQRFLLRRFGCFSILREGADREAIRYTANLLAKGDRPVVLFPEGTWCRQNDRVGPFQEGLSLIVRQAVKSSDRSIVIHPVGIKYWLIEDARKTFQQRLEQLEARLRWPPQKHLRFVERLEKFASALLATKEIEHFTVAQSGTLDERICRLIDSHVAQLEQRYYNRTFEGHALERIRRVRIFLVKRLQDRGEEGTVRTDLDTLLDCENLHGHSLAYLLQTRSPERFAEAILRIEETLDDDAEKKIARVGGVVRFGAAIDARNPVLPGNGSNRAGEALTQHLAQSVQQMLDDFLRQGPPAEWRCPTYSLDDHFVSQPSVTK